MRIAKESIFSDLNNPKVNKDDLVTEAQAALQQIEDRDYDAELRAQGVETILHYGIAFYGKRVQVELT